MKKIFNNRFLTHLQNLKSISGFNRDLRCSVKTNEKLKKFILNDVMPMKGDFEHENECRSSDR